MKCNVMQYVITPWKIFYLFMHLIIILYLIKAVICTMNDRKWDIF